jgi:hypothetical protein
MEYQPLKFTLGQVDKAGDTLSKRKVILDEDEAWTILDNWRAAHHLPLHYISVNLARHARKVDKNALIARRLKRAPSIFSKLQREPKMLLKRMQDIAGCRAIMPNLQKAIQLSQSFQKSSQNHHLDRVKDYITNPKPSGYRGVHLIYKFNSNDPRTNEWNGRCVEIQIRSVYQHLWATAVEIVGMMTHQALKSSNGSVAWLEFFKFVSEAFSILDQKKLVPDELCRKITNSANKLEVQKRLTTYSHALQHAKHPKANFYLLTVVGLKLTIQAFVDPDLADQAYLIAEKKLSTLTNADVVLVGAESFHELRKAYPNYFGDSVRFVKLLDTLIISRKHWWQR